MGVFLSCIATFLHIFLCLAGAPLLWGITNKLHARLLGCRGPSLWQPYRQLAKLVGKAGLLPDTATELFTVWPLVACLALAVGVMLCPGFCTGMLTAHASDYVTFIGFLALARAALLLSGLETGSAIMGAVVGRLLLRSACTEAVLLVLLLVFACLAHETTLNGLALAFHGGQAGVSVSMGFGLAAMLALVCTVVKDHVADHQGLEYAGRHLALLTYAGMLRRLLWMNLAICIFLPQGMARAEAFLSWPLGLMLWAGKLLFLAAGLAALAVVRAAPGLSRISEYSGLALFLGLMASLLLGLGVGVEL